MSELISAITEDSYSIDRKKQELAKICAIFYGGNAERAKAALDLRITRYLHPLLNHSDSEIRKQTLLIFYQLSRALASDNDLELIDPEPLQIHTADLENTKEQNLSKSMDLKKSKHIPDVAKDKTLVNFVYGSTALHNPIDTKRYINFAKELPTVHFEQNREYFIELGKVLENPVYSSVLCRILKDSNELLENKLLVVRIMLNLFTAGKQFVRSLNSAITDGYLTLAKLLKTGENKPKSSPEYILSNEIKQLFTKLFELRDPTINHFLLNHMQARDLLTQTGLKIPALKTMQDLREKAEFLWSSPTSDETILINTCKIPEFVKDLKSFLINNAQKSDPAQYAKLVILSNEILCRTADIIWEKLENSKRKDEMFKIIDSCVDFWTWISEDKNKHEILLEAKNCTLLDWILTKMTPILSISGIDENNKKLINLGIRMQKILSLLLKSDNEHVVEFLESISYGTIFGQHLQLQFEALKLHIENKGDQDWLLNLYPEQNYLRISMLETLLKSGSKKMKSQFLKSRFIERMIADYLKDLRKFNIRLDKIDLKFLAFCHCYPLRNESIEFIGKIIEYQENSKDIYTELMQRLQIHLIIPHECEIIRNYENEPELLVQTSLMLLERVGENTNGKNKKDERIVEAISEIMVRKPSFKKQFKKLNEFIEGSNTPKSIIFT